MMVSADSKYDKVKRGEKTFTSSEQHGYSVFQTKCASCHKEPLFTDLSYRNTGLPISDFLQDYGRMNITGKKEDSIKFRVPTLRNVMLTYPYGHDGRFYTIDQVLNHYTRDVKNTPDVDPLVKDKISLSIQERSDLKQFLATLSDSTFINDKRFSEPQ
jgi:cytochrome c peroxidase